MGSISQVVHVDSLCAELCFLGNVKVYLYFPPFCDIEMVQVIENLSQEIPMGQRKNYITPVR